MLRGLVVSLLFAGSAHASGILDEHILPGFDTLAERAETFEATAEQECFATSPSLRAAWVDTLNAWTGVSHLRFGPAEVDNRGFALAFWPDSRGKTQKALKVLIADQDAAVYDLDAFSEVSIAARGLYAAEYLLFDPVLSVEGGDGYRCVLLQAIARGISATARDMAVDWQDRYAALLRNPGPDGLYRSEEEVKQEYFKALMTGLEVTSELRLGRPMGTFDRPRPTRAEAWRSGQSLQQVRISLIALHDLALRLAASDHSLQERLDVSFRQALENAANLGDPTFSGVAKPTGRIRVEALQQRVNDIRAIVTAELGPDLGISAGFNSLDGD